MNMVPNHRIIPTVSPEVEWTYLINETLAGEKCILPLLGLLANDRRLPTSLRNVINRQIEEESDHIQRYENLISAQSIQSTGYENEFSDFVQNIGPATLKIYALQAILESVSLGALNYRLNAFPDSPSMVDDQQILRDEEGHVRFGLAFLKHLQEIDGVIHQSAFDDAAHRANAIFARHFNGASIASSVARNFGKKSISSQEIDSSIGMKIFKRTSAQIIVQTKNEFLRRYFSVPRPRT